MTLGLMGTATPGAGPASAPFSPADLFASAEPGFWHDVDPAHLRRNPDGTGAVSVGDPVGWIEDRSGRGKHAVQATSAARPVLRRSGALYYLEFDGVDDTMEVPALGITGAQPREYMAAQRGWCFTIASFGASGSRWTVNGNQLTLRVEVGGATHSSSLDMSGVRVAGARLIGPTLRDHVLSVDGVEQDAFGGAAVITDDAPALLGARHNGTAEEGDYYGGVLIGRVLTPDERGALLAYLAKRAGVAA
jgi:hypothetical protein